MEEVVEVDVLEWYGTAPDREEIKNSIKAGQEQGWKLVDQKAYATTYFPEDGDTEPEEHHVVILYFGKKSMVK